MDHGETLLVRFSEMVPFRAFRGLKIFLMKGDKRMFLKRSIIVALLSLFMAPAVHASENGFKEDVKDAAHETGQAFKKAGREIKDTSKEVGREIKEGFKKAGKETGSAMKKMGKEIGQTVKGGAKDGGKDGGKGGDKDGGKGGE